MLRLSKKSEYALQALLCMARNPGQIHTIPKVSASAKVPPKFLEQILLSLRQAGLLVSRRGAGGGYLFNRDPSTIRLLDAVMAVEGGDFGAPPPTDDTVGNFFSELNEMMLAKLRDTSLQDLLATEQAKLGANFEI